MDFPPDLRVRNATARPGAAAQATSTIAAANGNTDGIGRRDAELSPRELEIACLIAKGHPNKIIAAMLDISPWTVAAHLRRIYIKYSVRCRAAMVAKLLSSEGKWVGAVVGITDFAAFGDVLWG